MKSSQTFLRGLMAMVLLGSVSCMNRNFQALPLETNSKNIEDQVIPETSPREPIPEKQSDLTAPEDAPIPVKKSDTKPAPGPSTPTKSEKQEPTKNNEKAAETKDDSTRNKPANDNSKDFTGPGVLKPTIYYFPSFNEDESKCEKNTMMHGTGGKDLLMVCQSTAKECGLQGSCAITQNGVTRSFNILGAKDGQDRFFEIGEQGCRYGYGVESACLDPFYTLAADLNLYEPGEVIFVPAVVGTKLPDGSQHSGYFVIRDRGRGVTGTGRFDFFSGLITWKDAKNPFTKMGLGDVKTNIPYFKVKGKTAQQVLLHRAFPKLPKTN